MEALWGRTGAEAEKAAQKLGVTFHTSQVAYYLIVVFGQKLPSIRFVKIGLCIRFVKK